MRTLERQAERRLAAKAELSSLSPPPSSLVDAIVTPSPGLTARRDTGTDSDASTVGQATSSKTVAPKARLPTHMTPPPTPTPTAKTMSTPERKFLPEEPDEEEVRITKVREVKKRKAEDNAGHHALQQATQLGFVVQFIDEAGLAKRVRPWHDCNSVESIFRHAAMARLIHSSKANDPLVINIVGNDARDFRVMNGSREDKIEFEELATLVQGMRSGVIEVRAC